MNMTYYFQTLLLDYKLIKLIYLYYKFHILSIEKSSITLWSICIIELVLTRMDTRELLLLQW